MKCPKCNTHKPMGNAQARAEDGSIVPTWLCSPCGCNVLKTVSDELVEMEDMLSPCPCQNVEIDIDKETGAGFCIGDCISDREKVLYNRIVELSTELEKSMKANPKWYIPVSTELRKDPYFLFQEDKDIEFDESGLYPKGITEETKRSAMASAAKSVLGIATSEWFKDLARVQPMPEDTFTMRVPIDKLPPIKDIVESQPLTTEKLEEYGIRNCNIYTTKPYDTEPCYGIMPTVDHYSCILPDITDGKYDIKTIKSRQHKASLSAEAKDLVLKPINPKGKK